MSKIKGYTMEEVAEHRKDKLVSDYNFCKEKLEESDVMSRKLKT